MNKFTRLIANTGICTLFLGSSLAFAQLEPAPQAPRPGVPEEGFTRQAGVGAIEGFAHAGVVELGGSASYTSATNFSQFALSPSIGWFLMDNWQITGILSWSRSNIDGTDAVNVFSVLAEPSFHFPFNNHHFGFFGLGFGLATQTGADTGLAFAPRVGYKTLIGRSGIVTIDLRNTFATNDVIETPRGTALTVSSALSLGAGYTVLF
jgi:hypothetical protein